MNNNWEIDNETFSADYYRVTGWPAISFYVLGWETEPDEDTEWTGIEARTGNVIAVMVGDDYRHSIDPDDLKPIESDEFCHSCGQIGCSHNAYA